MYSFIKKIAALSLSTTYCILATAQGIDHWETAVYNTDQWSYYVGTSEPMTNWMQPNFDATSWTTGQGGFGYDDGDDNTIIPATTSVYIRTDFNLADTSVIKHLILQADYDDAFVAYLNGTEIARNNIGTVGSPPPYNALASTYKEANLYTGDQPEYYNFNPTIFRDLIKQGNNVLAIQVHNHTATSSDLSSNFFVTLGISDNSSNYRATPPWFIPPKLGSTLPLVVITTNGGATIQDEPKVTAHMGIIDNNGMNNLGDTYNGYDGFIGIEIRGASSQSFPKKNYGFETRLEDGTNNNVSILGMPEENDWVLHGPYADKSLLRNVLAYHMGTTTGRYTPRTQLCELYVNDDYCGVYMMTERIKRDKNRVDISNLKEEDIEGEELTGGYIFQIDRDDNSTTEDGWRSSSSPSKFYAYHDPDLDELQPVQKQYLRQYVTDFENVIGSNTYLYRYKDFVDEDSWVDYFLVTEIGKHIDAFKLSFYMHKKKSTNGGKINFGPLWDFNLGFGNFDFACPPDPEGWTYEFQGTCDNSHPFWVKKMTNIPNVSHKMNCRWNDLRNGPLHTDSLMQFLDDKLAEMGDAPERNFNRWPTLGQYVWPNDFVGDTYEEEIDFLKSWLTTRLEWMDDNMLGDCNLVSVETPTKVYNPVGIYPNPVNDYFYLDTEVDNYQGVTVQVHNMMGKLVLTQNVNKSVVKIQVNNLTSGIYFCNIVDNGTVIASSKLIKQ